MERKFFGMSIEIWDTKGNRLLTDVLLHIEQKLSCLFDVPVDGMRSFGEWIAHAKDARPQMGYLLDWMEEDADISTLCQYDLDDFPSTELLDEFNVIKMILRGMDKNVNVVVLCSDFADAVEALGDALKREINRLVELDSVFDVFETSAGHMDWLNSKICWQPEYVDVTRLDDVAASYKSEVAFSIAA